MFELGPAVAATSSAATAEALTAPAHVGPAVAATSSAAEVGTPTPPAQPGPAVVATSSAATAASFQPASNDDSFVPADAHFVAPQATAAPAMWFAPNAFDTPGPQWFAGLAPADSFGISGTQPASFGHGSEGIGIATMETGSVFSAGSGDNWGGAHDASYVVSELPFTTESFDDAPLYTAASDTPWILVADFTGDGWFFV